MEKLASAPDSPPEGCALPATIRRDGWTPERQRRFCEVLADCGHVEQAAMAVGMSREGAYRLRNRAAGRAFALAWDAALLLARQRMIDLAIETAIEGSLERHFRDGKLVLEKRRRDPRGLLAVIEGLGSRQLLATAPVRAVAGDFEQFLDCMQADARCADGQTERFMAARANAAGPGRESLDESCRQLALWQQVAASE